MLKIRFGIFSFLTAWMSNVCATSWLVFEGGLLQEIISRRIFQEFICMQALLVTKTIQEMWPGLEITAGQHTMSELIWGLTGQPFVLPVMLTGHIWSFWKWNKLKFPCCSVVSVVASRCVLSFAELWSEILGEMQQEPLLTMSALKCYKL